MFRQTRIYLFFCYVSRETVSVSFADEPHLQVDVSSKKIILSFVILSEEEPTLSISFNGQSLTIGGRHVVTKTMSSSSYNYAFEVTEVGLLYILLELAVHSPNFEPVRL